MSSPGGGYRAQSVPMIPDTPLDHCDSPAQATQPFPVFFMESIP